MDHFGIGAAISGAANIYFRSARGTGRTLSMVESVRDGDRIVFTNMTEARRVKRMLEERGKKVECIVSDPAYLGDLFGRVRKPIKGRTILDHSWVEHFYLNAIARAQIDLDEIQLRTSPDDPREENEFCAREIGKWSL